jgi:glycosyltransferase involved in cell wall biosynthesis
MNNTADLISVIVPNYNHAGYLDQRIGSLLDQTYPSLEIIVIDNCSTDNSLDVLAGYKNKARVKIVALAKNGGYVNSCNLGVSLARGKFIMFAESDDFNAPSHIELLHQAMAGNDTIGVGFCRSLMVDASGRVFDEDFNHRDNRFKELCSKDTLIPQRLAQRFFLFSCIIPNMSAALIRRKYFDVAGGFSPHYKACPDWDFWSRISRCCDFYYLATPLNNFRRHGASHQSLLGIRSLVIESMELLYTALRKADLTFWEQLHFRVNIGVIWGRYRKPASGVWWKSFPSIWRQSLKYDKLSLVFLILAFIKRSAERLMGRC